MSITADNFFKPGHISAEQKLTPKLVTAKSIAEQEAAERAEKNERLRAMRLAKSQLM